MPQIHLDSAQISQLKISDFADFTNLSGDQKAVIEVNGNKFHVTVPANDGNVSVALEKKNGFFSRIFGFFGRAGRESIRQQIQNRISLQVGQWRNSIAHTPSPSSVNGTKHALDTLVPGAASANAPRSEVAVYGFDSVRNANIDILGNAIKNSSEQRNVTFSTIDLYNRGIGITWDSIAFESLSGFIQDIKSGTIAIGQNSSSIPRDKLSAWAKFLQRPGNLEKIDIFGRLGDYVSIGDSPSRAQKKLPGWKGEFARRGTQEAMEAFVRKNLTSDIKYMGATDDDIPRVAKALIELARGNHPTIDGDTKGIMNEVVKTAFFRQTSKLGLNFFKEKGTPVMFYWMNFTGFSMPDNNSTLSDKWWHNPDAKISDHNVVYVTFSEMRHVQKMQISPADYRGVGTVGKVMGQGIPV